MCCLTMAPKHQLILLSVLFFVALGRKTEDETASFRKYQRLNIYLTNHNDAIPVVDVWSPERKHPAARSAMINVHMERINNLIATVLGQVNNRRSITVMSRTIYENFSRKIRVCLRESGEKVECNGEYSVPPKPCSYLRISQVTPFTCDLDIRSMTGVRLNVTVINSSLPFCDNITDINLYFNVQNHIIIGRSRPFCGQSGGLVTMTSNATVTVDMSKAAFYDSSLFGLQHGRVELLLAYEEFEDAGGYQQPAYIGEAAPMGTGDSGGLQFVWVAPVIEGEWGFYYFTTTPDHTACLEYLLWCLTSFETQIEMIVTQGSPEVRHQGSTRVGAYSVNCTGSVSYSFTPLACASIGDMTVAVRSFHLIKTEVPALAFKSKPIVCSNTSDTMMCKKTSLQPGHHLYRNYTILRPQPYIYMDHDVVSTGYLSLEIVRFEMSGVRVSECGGGGLYLTTEYRGWDMGVYCGGISSNVLQHFQGKHRIQLAKRLRVIYKSYIPGLKMSLAIKIQSESEQNNSCIGYVNVFPATGLYYNETILINMTYMKIGYSDRLIMSMAMRKGGCFQLMYVHSDAQNMLARLQRDIYVHCIYDTTEDSAILTTTNLQLMPNSVSTNQLFDDMIINILDIAPDSYDPQAGYIKTVAILARDVPTLQITANAVLIEIPPKSMSVALGELVIFQYKARGENTYRCLSAESPISHLDIASTSVCGDVYIRTIQQILPMVLTFPFNIKDTVKDDCCLLKLNVSFEQCSDIKNSKYLLRVISKRNALVHRSAYPFNTSQYDKDIEIYTKYPELQTDYLVGSFTVEYDVTEETGSFDLFLPHQHQTRILIANNDNPQCQVNISFTYQKYSSVHVINKKSTINGSEICLEETCYSFSIVKNVSWDEASQLCERKGLSLPQFHTASQLSSLLVASLEYIDYASLKTSMFESIMKTGSRQTMYVWNLTHSLFGYSPLLDVGRNLVHTGGTLIGSNVLFLTDHRNNVRNV